MNGQGFFFNFDVFLYVGLIVSSWHSELLGQFRESDWSEKLAGTVPNWFVV